MKKIKLGALDGSEGGFQPINWDNAHVWDGGSDEKKKRDFNLQYPVTMDEVFYRPTPDRIKDINHCVEINLIMALAIDNTLLPFMPTKDNVLQTLLNRSEITQEEYDWFKSDKQ